MIADASYLEKKSALAKKLQSYASIDQKDWDEVKQREFLAASDEYDAHVQEHEAAVDRAKQTAERDDRLARLKEAEHDMTRYTDAQVAGSRDPANYEAREEAYFGLGLQAWATRGRVNTSRHQEALKRFQNTFNTREGEMLVNTCPRYLADGYQGFRSSNSYCKEVQNKVWNEEQAYHRRDWATDGGGGTSGAGDFIPRGFRRQLEDAMLAFGGLQNIAQRWNTSGSDPIDIPLSDDTANAAVILPEADPLATGDPDTDTIVSTTVKFYSKEVKVSAEMLEDSFISIPTYLAGRLGERLARGLAGFLVTGSGVAGTEPQGLLAAGGASLGITLDDVGITYQNVLDIEHSIDPAYRGDPSFSFCFHDTTLKEFRKIVDGQNRPLWQPGMIPGAPDTVFGIPYQVDQSYPAFAATNDIMTIGAHNRFLVRTHAAMRFYHLKELRRANDQESFVAFVRHDSRYLNAGTNPIKKVNAGAQT